MQKGWPRKSRYAGKAGFRWMRMNMPLSGRDPRPEWTSRGRHRRRRAHPAPIRTGRDDPADTLSHCAGMNPATSVICASRSARTNAASGPRTVSGLEASGDGLMEAGAHVHGELAVFSSSWGHFPQVSFDQGIPAASGQLGQLLGADRLGCGLLGDHRRSLVWRQDGGRATPFVAQVCNVRYPAKAGCRPDAAMFSSRPDPDKSTCISQG
jgi:hypothetical protein